MSDWQHLRNEEESDTIRDVRAVAQTQFIQASERIVQLERDLQRVKTAHRSARRRASELGEALRDEIG